LQGKPPDPRLRRGALYDSLNFYLLWLKLGRVDRACAHNMRAALAGRTGFAVMHRTTRAAG